MFSNATALCLNPARLVICFIMQLKSKFLSIIYHSFECDQFLELLVWSIRISNEHDNWLGVMLNFFNSNLKFKLGFEFKLS